MDEEAAIFDHETDDDWEKSHDNKCVEEPGEPTGETTQTHYSHGLQINEQKPYNFDKH